MDKGRSAGEAWRAGERDIECVDKGWSAISLSSAGFSGSRFTSPRAMMVFLLIPLPIRDRFRLLGCFSAFRNDLRTSAQHMLQLHPGAQLLLAGNDQVMPMFTSLTQRRPAGSGNVNPSSAM